MKYILLLALITSVAHAQNCGTSSGINLTSSGKSYSSLWPRDQGSVGTCYVHSASDLLSSYLGTSSRVNVYEAAIANDSEADGGQPAEVMDTLIKRGWACLDNGQFSNLFPSQTQNIISELTDAVVGAGMPVFYSNDPYGKDGAARQAQIAELAGKLANKEVQACGPYKDADVGVEEYVQLNKVIAKIDKEISRLEDEKDVLDGWFGTRETKDIDKDIEAQWKKKNNLKLKADAAHSRYLSGLSILNGGQNRLDDLSIQQAAEVVYYWAEKSYPAVQKVFQKYGMESSAPTMKQYIIEKVKRDPIHQYKYAGGMYPYKLISRVMENACAPHMRIKIPNNIKSRSLRTSSAGQTRIAQQIDNTLQKNPNQGIGISIHANLLQASSDDSLHAVNIIGCRTVDGVKEYLIHNSWGSGCNSYHQSLRSKCSGGRVWIRANSVLNSSTEIQWIEKK